MAEGSALSIESNRLSEMRDSPGRTASAYAPWRPPIALPRASAERRSRPAGCERRGCTIRARPHKTGQRNRAARWRPAAAEARWWTASMPSTRGWRSDRACWRRGREPRRRRPAPRPARGLARRRRIPSSQGSHRPSQPRSPCVPTERCAAAHATAAGPAGRENSAWDKRPSGFPWHVHRRHGSQPTAAWDPAVVHMRDRWLRRRSCQPSPAARPGWAAAREVRSTATLRAPWRGPRPQSPWFRARLAVRSPPRPRRCVLRARPAASPARFSDALQPHAAQPGRWPDWRGRRPPGPMRWAADSTRPKPGRWSCGGCRWRRSWPRAFRRVRCRFARHARRSRRPCTSDRTWARRCGCPHARTHPRPGLPSGWPVRGQRQWASGTARFARRPAPRPARARVPTPRACRDCAVAPGQSARPVNRSWPRRIGTPSPARVPQAPGARSHRQSRADPAMAARTAPTRGARSTEAQSTTSSVRLTVVLQAVLRRTSNRSSSAFGMG